MAPAASRTLAINGGIASAAGGNSAAAHACQQNGFQDVFRSNGTPFANTGECVSYAAHGGVFVTRVTATFTNVLLSACNSLTWGYVLDGVATDVETKPYFCGDQNGGDVTITYLSNQTLTVYVRDNTCGATYYQDGNHAAVTGTNPYLIRIADSGGFCERGPDVAWTPVGDQLGNFNVTKTLP
ncbi:MAG TPA: hypothetical protein VJ867_02210 [Gemmatimonadaceae bacterium]|nr:hypothetical protein [Gemmatimonadaceae bacterium]